ncbi:MAG: hypothetical protein M1818_004190 [Claussenomyces sp. TS43310]|nr:MAG: hypothetical protein M1818_004190 [Claussenomyces sp. TS43310]
MTSLSAHHPSLALHLTDPALGPLVSSSTTRPSLEALNALQTASLTTYTTAARLGLGLPQRVMIETARGGPVLLHSYLSPQSPQRSAATSAHRGARDAAGESVTVDDVAAETREGLTALREEDVQGEGGGDDNATPHGRGLVNGADKGKRRQQQQQQQDADDGDAWDEQDEDEDEDEDEDDAAQAPLLIATVVAPSPAQAREARRVVGRLERVGVEFQREWMQGLQNRDEGEESVEAHG